MPVKAALMACVGLAAVGARSAAEPAAPPSYRPVTSDLMNTIVQPRHIKLWLAGSGGDWEYAEYERHNIGGALARIATAIPDYKGRSMADLIEAFATPQLADLEIAIKAKDPAAFGTAYEALTLGCNQCHQATNHAYVVIKRPSSDPFADQGFSAP